MLAAMRRNRPLGAVLGALLLAAAGGCRKSPAEPWRGMNVIWISFDSAQVSEDFEVVMVDQFTTMLDLLSGVRITLTLDFGIDLGQGSCVLSAGRLQP